jgi:hypothetical protein
MLIIVIDSILIESSFQNSYASKDNSTDFKTTLLPFNSHIADQAKGEKTSLNDIIPFP